MKYLLGRVSLGVCFLISSSLMAKDEDTLTKSEGKISYSLFYMQDRYGVKDGRNIFKKNYKRYGTLLVSKDNYFYKKTIKLAWGLGVGLGYNQGNPKFVSGVQSNIVFRLYTLILDTSVAGEIQPANFLKLTVKLGPSFMGLHQYRNDFEPGESGKNIYQIGVGGFAHAVVKAGLGELFPSWGRTIYAEYGINGLFLNLGVRYQYYGAFRNSKIKSVDGLSYMMGLSFEFR